VHRESTGTDNINHDNYGGRWHWHRSSRFIRYNIHIATCNTNLYLRYTIIILIVVFCMRYAAVDVLPTDRHVESSHCVHCMRIDTVRNWCEQLVYNSWRFVHSAHTLLLELTGRNKVYMSYVTVRCYVCRVCVCVLLRKGIRMRNSLKRCSSQVNELFKEIYVILVWQTGQ